MTKYYQLTHNDDSVGVIKVENKKANVVHIQEAIEGHFGCDAEVKSVEFYDDDYALEITFTTEDGEDVVYGRQTWLYF